MHRALTAVLLTLVLATAALADERPAVDPPADPNATDAPAADPHAADGAAQDAAAVVLALKSKEDAERLTAATDALGIADDAVTKPLVRLLIDDRFEIRAAAIRALGVRTTDKGRRAAAKGLCALIPRLAKSAENEGELALVVRSLHDLAQPSSIDPLMKDVEDSSAEDLYRARVMAVANVPDAEAIEALIQHLARRGRGRWGGMRRAVTDALRYATGQKLGNDPDKWRSWWHDAKKTFDFEAAAARREESREKEEQRAERKKGKGRKKRGKK